MDPGLGGGGGGGWMGGVGGMGAGGGTLPTPARVCGVGEHCKLPQWPQKLCNFIILKS